MGLIHRQSERSRAVSHQDFQAPQVAASQRSLEELLPMFEWVGDFASSGIKFGPGCAWSAVRLTQLALAWGWKHCDGLVKGFNAARKTFDFADESLQDASRSYQAFLKLMQRHGDELAQLVTTTLRQKMREDARFIHHGRTAFAFDGTKVGMPITESNQDHFCSKKKSPKKGASNNSSNLKKAQNPQVLVTLCWHVNLSLPWAWRQSGLAGSERGHATEMIAELPKNSLVLADAGFTGYNLWKRLIEKGHDFIIRIGSNVKLLSSLGYSSRRGQQVVYLWPDQRRKEKPLVLRLIKLGKGKDKVYLATTNLDPKKLTRAQAKEWYALRWGVEVYIRDYKQTLECRKLLSRTPAAVHVECEWTMLSHWLLAAYTRLQAVPADQKPSLQGAIDAVRETMANLQSQTIPREPLLDRLRKAVVDQYSRSHKASRNYPQKKKRRPPGQPKIRIATAAEVQAAKELGFMASAGLTA